MADLRWESSAESQLDPRFRGGERSMLEARSQTFRGGERSMLEARSQTFRGGERSMLEARSQTFRGNERRKCVPTTERRASGKAPKQSPSSAMRGSGDSEGHAGMASAWHRIPVSLLECCRIVVPPAGTLRFVEPDAGSTCWLIEIKVLPGRFCHARPYIRWIRRCGGNRQSSMRSGR